MGTSFEKPVELILKFGHVASFEAEIGQNRFQKLLKYQQDF